MTDREDSSGKAESPIDDLLIARLAGRLTLAQVAHVTGFDEETILGLEGDAILRAVRFAKPNLWATTEECLSCDGDGFEYDGRNERCPCDLCGGRGFFPRSGERGTNP